MAARTSRAGEGTPLRRSGSTFGTFPSAEEGGYESDDRAFEEDSKLSLYRPIYKSSVQEEEPAEIQRIVRTTRCPCIETTAIFEGPGSACPATWRYCFHTIITTLARPRRRCLSTGARLRWTTRRVLQFPAGEPLIL